MDHRIENVLSSKKPVTNYRRYNGPITPKYRVVSTGSPAENRQSRWSTGFGLSAPSVGIRKPR